MRSELLPRLSSHCIPRSSRAFPHDTVAQLNNTFIFTVAAIRRWLGDPFRTVREYRASRQIVLTMKSAG
jgi:hypothetical protein